MALGNQENSSIFESAGVSVSQGCRVEELGESSGTGRRKNSDLMTIYHVSGQNTISQRNPASPALIISTL